MRLTGAPIGWASLGGKGLFWTSGTKAAKNLLPAPILLCRSKLPCRSHDSHSEPVCTPREKNIVEHAREGQTAPRGQISDLMARYSEIEAECGREPARCPIPPRSERNPYPSHPGQSETAAPSRPGQSETAAPSPRRRSPSRSGPPSLTRQSAFPPLLSLNISAYHPPRHRNPQQ